MADVFREVDEDLRREQLKRLWDRFGIYLIALAVLIVLGVSSYKVWEYWTNQQAASSGDRFIAAMDLSDQGNNTDSIKALQAITTDGSGAYPVLARFAIASQKADNGDKTGAVADYDAIAARTDVSADIRTMARLRAALLLVDTSSVADLQKRVGDLTGVGNPWRQSAREVLALGAWNTGDYATSKDYFTQISADQESAQDVRDRATVMLTLLATRLPATPVALAPPAPTGSGATVAATPAPAATTSAPAALSPAPATTPAAPATTAPADTTTPPPAALSPAPAATPVVPPPTATATPAPTDSAAAPAATPALAAAAPAPTDSGAAPATAAPAPDAAPAAAPAPG